MCIFLSELGASPGMGKRCFPSSEVEHLNGGPAVLRVNSVQRLTVAPMECASFSDGCTNLYNEYTYPDVHGPSYVIWRGRT